MGRMKKITAEEVQEVLEENIGEERLTVSGIATQFGVTAPTVRKRLRELRAANIPIIHDREGLLLLSRELMDDADEEEIHLMFHEWLEWLWGSLFGLVQCGKPTQRYFAALRRRVATHLTREERKQLSMLLLKIKFVTDSVDIGKD